jgi:hypothetical protein
MAFFLHPYMAHYQSLLLRSCDSVSACRSSSTGWDSASAGCAPVGIVISTAARCAGANFKCTSASARCTSVGIRCPSAYPRCVSAVAKYSSADIGSPVAVNSASEGVGHPAPVTDCHSSRSCAVMASSCCSTAANWAPGPAFFSSFRYTSTAVNPSSRETSRSPWPPSGPFGLLLQDPSLLSAYLLLFYHRKTCALISN